MPQTHRLCPRTTPPYQNTDIPGSDNPHLPVAVLYHPVFHTLPAVLSHARKIIWRMVPESVSDRHVQKDTPVSPGEKEPVPRMLPDALLHSKTYYIS